MATEQHSIDSEPSEPHREEVHLSVEPGTKLTISIEVGDKAVAGKVPLTISVEQSAAPLPQAVMEQIPTARTPQPPSRPLRIPTFKLGGIHSGFEALGSRLRARDLATWLFISALAVYLLTRLVGLTQFPIYFFTDEAIQSLSMLDLIDNGYRDPEGVLFPTYFRNGEYYNIGLSVYLQWLPALLFGKSAVATRVMSILVTLIAAVSIGIILRQVFKLKYWWTGTLFLSLTPAWFLHSRTAFETVEFVALYAGALCTYLLYRYKSVRYLYLTVLLGAMAFYTYSPGQMIVPLTAAGLLISDWRYHWQNRRSLPAGLVLGAVLAVPYIRYNLSHPNVPFAHLHTLWSYWFEEIPLSEKFARYFSEFGIGLSPWYWYIPNDRDLARHLMKDYGHILIATLPFTVLGLAHILRRLREPASRAILVALVISPAASALVQIAITRVLVFVIPAAILAAIGLERVLQWLEDPQQQIDVLAEGSGPTPRRNVAAFLILFTGMALALQFRENIDQAIFQLLVILLALQVSGVFERLAQFRVQAGPPNRPKLWKLSHPVLALSAFIVLAGVNVRMLNDALTNGPLWFRDYGLGGMQYGAFQIFDIIEEYLDEHPQAQIILSPDWANGADVVARYMLEDFTAIQMGSVRGHTVQKLPLDGNTLFIMTPYDYDFALENEKFSGVEVERIIPFPDGSPGFYFVHLSYADDIDEVFAAEKAAREALRETTVSLDGQDVKLRYSYLDSDFQAESMALVFDGDPFTVTKTFEANPFVIEMTFPSPRTVNGFSIIIGEANVRVTLKCFAGTAAEPVMYAFESQGTRNQPELSYDLPAPTQAEVLQVEVLDLRSQGPAKVHIWELTLR